MDSTHNEGKSVVAERFIKTLKNKIDKLAERVNEYNSTYHGTIKMKPTDVKDSTYININKEVNDNDPKCKVGDHVRISKYKNFLLKAIIQIGLKKFL